MSEEPRRTSREARRLAVLLRALSLFVALILVARFVPMIWRTVAEGAQVLLSEAGALSTTPAALILVLALVVAGALVLRARRRSGRSARRQSGGRNPP